MFLVLFRSSTFSLLMFGVICVIFPLSSLSFPHTPPPFTATLLHLMATS